MLGHANSTLTMKTNFYSNISNEKNYENEKKSLKTKKSCR
jgi:hypothetical protein